MLPEAIKNPLIYLNFAIFCWRTKRFDLANANLNNFYDLANSTNVRHEVSLQFFNFPNLWSDLIWYFFLFFFFGIQFKLIADKFKEFLPETTRYEATTIVALEAPIDHTQGDGAGETMAEYDPNSDLVWNVSAEILQFIEGRQTEFILIYTKILNTLDHF